MTNKKTILSLVAIFAALFLISFAGALTATTPAQLTIANNQSSFTITNNQNYSQTISISPTSFTFGTAANSVALTINPITSLGNGTTSAPITITSIFVGTLPFGTYTQAINITGTATGENATTAPITVTFYKGFCTNGPVGTNLSLKGIDISNDGDEDATWMPLDTITVDVDFENNGNDKVKSVVIELAIFDSTGKEQTGEFDFLNSDEEKVTYGSLDEGDDDQVTFEFQVPADIEEGDYQVVAKVYSTNELQINTCSEEIGDAITVEKQSDTGKYISFDNIELSPSEAACGETVTLTADVYNVGDEDQDQVKVTLYNKELSISTSYELKSGLDMGDSDSVSFEFVMPSGLSNKNYNLELSAEYDYRSSSDVYREELDDSTDVTLKVIGCAAQTTTGLSGITASLESDAKAGSDLEITTTIKNLGSTSATLIISALDYESWATLNSISDATITLAAGASKNVTISLKVNEGVSGEQTFNIESKSGTKVDSKTVAVEITEGSWLSSLTGSFGSNSTLWIIGAVNLLLIALIVFLIIKVFRK